MAFAINDVIYGLREEGDLRCEDSILSLLEITNNDSKEGRTTIVEEKAEEGLYTCWLRRRRPILYRHRLGFTKKYEAKVFWMDAVGCGLVPPAAPDALDDIYA